MKYFFLSIGFIFTFFVVSAQNNLTHIVKSGETLSGIAKQYKVLLKDVEAINNINEKVIIRVGQKLVIPLGKTSTAKTTTTTNNTATANAPMVSKNQYKVVAGDNMTKIARMFNVQEKQLLEWNNLKSDLILVGQVLYINKPESFVAKKQEAIAPKPQPKPVVNEEKNTEIASPKVQQTTTKSIEEPKQVSNNEALVTPTVKDVKKEIEQPIAKQEVNLATTTSTIPSAFEGYYSATGNNINVKAATFKTGAGWQDKKFYILSNTIATGTTVKLHYKNKSTYAKVLGTLPQQANEEQVQIRMSTATAASIGAFDAVFDVEIMY